MKTLRGGAMWSKICSSREPWRSIGKLLIVPALLGLVIAPTVAFWIPAGMWPNTFTVSLGFGALSLIAILMTLGIIQRVNKQNEFEIEEILSTLGILLALVYGILALGLDPSKWKDRAISKDKNVAEQGASSDR
ncbi:hypothetical protein [Oceaniferula spumae]